MDSKKRILPLSSANGLLGGRMGRYDEPAIIEKKPRGPSGLRFPSEGRMAITVHVPSQQMHSRRIWVFSLLHNLYRSPIIVR